MLVFISGCLQFNKMLKFRIKITFDFCTNNWIFFTLKPPTYEKKVLTSRRNFPGKPLQGIELSLWQATMEIFVQKTVSLLGTNAIFRPTLLFIFCIKFYKYFVCLSVFINILIWFICCKKLETLCAQIQETLWAQIQETLCAQIHRSLW